MTSKTCVFIEPAYKEHMGDRIFDEKMYQDPSIVIPFLNLRSKLASVGIAMHTSDMIPRFPDVEKKLVWSMGETSALEYATLSGVEFRGIIIAEPPLIQYRQYRLLSKVASRFNEIYLYNSQLSSKFLSADQRYKYRNFFYPVSDFSVSSEEFNHTPRSPKAVLISGQHNPLIRRARLNFSNELYTFRLKLLRELGKSNRIDLYGRGWGENGIKSLYPYYQIHKRDILRHFKGSCADKNSVLKFYTFAVCVENTRLDGLVTEKIFDAFRAGCIPLYLGPHNIRDYIDENTFIDLSKIGIYNINTYLDNLTENDLQLYRKNISNFLSSERFKSYVNSLDFIYRDSLTIAQN